VRVCARACACVSMRVRAWNYEQVLHMRSGSLQDKIAPSLNGFRLAPWRETKPWKDRLRVRDVVPPMWKQRDSHLQVHAHIYTSLHSTLLGYIGLPDALFANMLNGFTKPFLPNFTKLGQHGTKHSP